MLRLDKYITWDILTASMVLMSLPESYTTHLETLTDVAIRSGHTFTAHNLISKAIELSDEHQFQANCEPKSGQKNSAFQSSESCSKGKKSNSSKKDVECFNCHKGNFAHNCCGPGGAKEGSQPSRGHPSKT